MIRSPLSTVGEVERQGSSATTTVLRVHVPEDGRIILAVSSRATMAATLHGYPMTLGKAGELVDLLQQVSAG